MRIVVEEGDALDLKADVLALKYAQALYGVDRAVFEQLSRHNSRLAYLLPKISEFRLIHSEQRIAANSILFVGVKPIWEFGYDDIREFGKKVLLWLAKEMPETKHVGLTIHGVGYGLDEAKAFESEILGLFDAINAGEAPTHLEQITIIELHVSRAERLRVLLPQLLPE